MHKLEVPTRSGTVLDGVLFPSSGADTVVIAITGIHGNFFSNPFYQNIGATLSDSGIDFIYAQTRDAFGKSDFFNKASGTYEQLGSFNEDFNFAEEDVAAYVDYALQLGYAHIILAGHSFGANKVINYLSIENRAAVEKFILISPANLKHLTSVVTETERRQVLQYVSSGRGKELLPFPLLGWLPCIADTAYQWLYSPILDNVHVEQDGDFSQIAKINQSGALIIGTHDRFTYGDPAGFLNNINDHMPAAKQNVVTIIPETGHTFQRKEQALAAEILRIVKHWRAAQENTNAFHFCKT